MSLHTVSVKVDSQTAQKLANFPNRSEFIRQALLDALRLRCPLCGGAGWLHAGYPLGRSEVDDRVQGRVNQEDS